MSRCLRTSSATKPDKRSLVCTTCSSVVDFQSNGFGSGNHALHLGIDHVPAGRSSVPDGREAAEGGRGQEEDNSVDAVHDDSPLLGQAYSFALFAEGQGAVAFPGYGFRLLTVLIINWCRFRHVAW